MARTPLARALSRLFRSVAESDRRGIPHDEWVDMEREGRAEVSRRRALGLAAGLPVALAACGGGSSGGGTADSDGGVPLGGDGGVDAGGSSQETRVAIVGAGLSGLHCAYKLQKLGQAALVFEADKTAGGRVVTDRTTFPEGMHCEVGAELIDSVHKTMLGLAAELGIDLVDYNTLVGPNGKAYSPEIDYFGGKALTSSEIATAWKPIAQKVKDAQAMLTNPNASCTYLNPNGGQVLDALSIKQFLDQNNVTGTIRSVLDVAYTTEYGLDTDVSSSLNLIQFIDPPNYDTNPGSDERFTTKGGNAAFIEKMVQKLPAGAITYGARLVRISKKPDGRYALTFDMGNGSSREVTAEHVVISLPFSVLRDVDLTTVNLPALKLKAIKEVGYGQNSKLMAGFSSRFWNTAGYDGTTLTDLPFQEAWDTSRLQPATSGIMTNYTGGAAGLAIGNGTPESQLATFIADLDKVFPGAKAASTGKVVRAAWPTNPFVKGSYSGYKVLQATTFAGVERERWENLHFCGEHTNKTYQGFMEGAVVSGARVATEIATDLGLGAFRALPRRNLLVPRRTG